MHAQLRSLTTADGDDLGNVSVHRDAFCVSLRAMIGPAGGEGEECFDFEVCSPAWLESELSRCGALSGRFMLIVSEYDPVFVESYVRGQVAAATGPDWASVAGKLARRFRWEFEG